MTRELTLTGSAPGVAWLPAVAAPGLVLLGHGGSGHKRSPRNVELGQWFAANGLAAVALDGPYHGDRAAPDYQARMVAAGMDGVLDRVTDEWLSAVSFLTEAEGVDGARVGYLGLSMGTRFGLPIAAALGERLRCAVLGKFGLEHHPDLPAGLARPDRAVREARGIRVPVLFHLQWDDEIFPRAGQLALFDEVGSPDKELMAYAGSHGETKPEAVVRWRDFIRRHLSGASV
jgi:dienelactone hydrolase